MGVARNDSFTSSGTRTSAACGRPRGSARGRRRGLGVDASSRRPRVGTGPHDGGNVERRAASNDSDAGTPLVVPSRRVRRQLSVRCPAPLQRRRQSAVDGGLLQLTVGRRKQSRPSRHGFKQLVTLTENSQTSECVDRTAQS